MTTLELPLPDVSLELLERRNESTPGFLELIRCRYRTLGPSGTLSREFVYDFVERRAMDAVVMAAYYVHDGMVWVYLRSALRPPVTLRSEQGSGTDTPHLWELPAGLVESGEETTEGVRRAAARETFEELGFDLDPSCFVPLGPSTHPAPAIIAEKQFFFRVRVRPDDRRAPELDGSPLEESGIVTSVSLERALSLCRNGHIVDAKTELGLRRLSEAVSNEL